MNPRLFKRLTRFQDGTLWNALYMDVDGEFYWTKPFQSKSEESDDYIEDFNMQDMMTLINNVWWEEVPV